MSEQLDENQKKQDQQFPGVDFSEDNLVDKQAMELPGAQESHMKNPKQKKTFKLSKKIVFFFIAVLLLTLIALAWIFIPPKDQAGQNKPAENQQPVNSEQLTQQTNKDGLSAELSESYTNDFLRITFKYPKSWKITDENDIIMAKSPISSYKLKDGTDKEGFFKFYIKKQAKPDDGKYLGQGYAVDASQKISYTQPQTGQRPTTFLTNFGLNTPDNFAYFIIQGNYNLKKGETLGPNYANEVDDFLISGGFGTVEKQKPLETDLLALDSFADNQEYKTAIEIVKSLQIK